MTMIAFALLACIGGFVALRAILPRTYFLWKVRKHLQFQSPISFERGRIVLSLPKLTLKESIFTRTVPLAEGASRQIAFDYFDDHADAMWTHDIWNRYGQFYLEQWTASYGSSAGLGEGVYSGRSLLTCRKLRKGEVRKLEAGDMIVQLRTYIPRDSDQQYIELIKPEVPAISAVPKAA